MADWVKLATNMFDNKKIKQIEVAPKGKQILLLWVRLICLAGTINDGGKVYVTDGVPYTLEGLAVELNENKSIVKNALELFERYNMIAYEEGCMYLPGWAEHQNVVGLEKIREQTRERVKRYRDAKRNATCNVTETDCNAEVTEQNKNKNKNKNKEKDIENNYDDNNSISPIPSQEKRNSKAIHTTTTSTLQEEVDSKALTDNIFLVWQNNISPLTPIVGEKVKALVEEYGEEAVLHGINAACEQNVRTIPYVTSCARNYLNGRIYSGGRQSKNDVAGTAQKVLEAIERGDGDAIWG